MQGILRYQLAFCITAAALVCLYAAPPRWSDAQQQDIRAEKPLDIWSDCSGPHAKAKLSNVIIIPDPPQKGQSLNITAQVTLFEDVTKGQVKVFITFDKFLPLINKVYDLCDLLGQVGKSCPLKKGPYDVGPVITKIPDDAPSGSYSGSVEVMDQNKQQVYCLKAAFKLQ